MSASTTVMVKVSKKLALSPSAYHNDTPTGINIVRLKSPSSTPNTRAMAKSPVPLPMRCEARLETDLEDRENCMMAKRALC